LGFPITKNGQEKNGLADTQNLIPSAFPIAKNRAARVDFSPTLTYI